MLAPEQARQVAVRLMSHHGRALYGAHAAVDTVAPTFPAPMLVCSPVCPPVRRFPIGLTEQVKTWEHSVLKEFWERWYFPANVTLYVVGDLERSTQETIALIEKTFGKVPMAREALPAGATAPAANGNGHANGNGNGNGNGAAAAPVLGPPKQRHAVRPPVVHKWGFGPLAEGGWGHGRAGEGLFGGRQCGSGL